MKKKLLSIILADTDDKDIFDKGYIDSWHSLFENGELTEEVRLDFSTGIPYQVKLLKLNLEFDKTKDEFNGKADYLNGQLTQNRCHKIFTAASVLNLSCELYSAKNKVFVYIPYECFVYDGTAF